MTASVELTPVGVLNIQGDAEPNRICVTLIVSGERMRSFPNAPVAGQVNPQRLLLCQWLVSPADDELLSLLSSADAMIRLVALERILSCLPNDPRYHRVWEGIRRELNNDTDSRQAQQILRNLEQPEGRRRDLATTNPPQAANSHKS